MMNLTGKKVNFGKMPYLIISHKISGKNQPNKNPDFYPVTIRKMKLKNGHFSIPKFGKS